MIDKLTAFIEENFNELVKVGIAVAIVILSLIITLLIILVAP